MPFKHISRGAIDTLAVNGSTRQSISTSSWTVWSTFSVLSLKFADSFLIARPCDSEGKFLPPDTAPPEEDLSQDWGHWKRRTKFEWAEATFEKMQSSEGDINYMLEILAAEAVQESESERTSTIYPSQESILADIDAITLGEALFDSYEFKWTGPLGDNPRPWKLKTWTLHARGAPSRQVFRNQLSTSESASSFDTFVRITRNIIAEARKQAIG